MKKIKKLFSILMILGLCLGLTGCVHLQNDIKVYSNGEYSSDIKLLVLEDIYHSLELDKPEYIEFFKEQFHIEKLEDIKMIDEKFNGQNYIGFEYKRKRNLASENTNIQIDVDKSAKQITFKLSNELSKDVWFFSDALNPKRSIEELDILLLMQVDMPGKIISTSIGEIDDDIVTIDLIKNNGQEIIITSEIESTIPRLSIIAFASVAMIATIIKFLNDEKKGSH